MLDDDCAVRRRTGASASWGGWTPELDARLRTLWADGMSTPRIGATLGCGKNAAIGRAHRLDLAARTSPVRKAPDGRLAIEVVREGLASGLTQREIARRSGLARQTVGRRAERLRGDVVAEPAVTLPPLPSARTSAPVVAVVTSLRLSPMHAAADIVVPPATPTPVFKPRPPGACCWPMWGRVKPTHVYCDASTVPGRVYCEAHCRKAYSRREDRQEAIAA